MQNRKLTPLSEPPQCYWLDWLLGVAVEFVDFQTEAKNSNNQIVHIIINHIASPPLFSQIGATCGLDKKHQLLASLEARISRGVARA